MDSDSEDDPIRPYDVQIYFLMAGVTDKDVVVAFVCSVLERCLAAFKGDPNYRLAEDALQAARYCEKYPNDKNGRENAKKKALEVSEFAKTVAMPSVLGGVMHIATSATVVAACEEYFWARTVATGAMDAAVQLMATPAEAAAERKWQNEELWRIIKMKDEEKRTEKMQETGNTRVEKAQKANAEPAVSNPREKTHEPKTRGILGLLARVIKRDPSPTEQQKCQKCDR